jgi:hypothetical protein
MAIVIKNIRGREYQYAQTSQRVAGKVVTKSVYLGPVKPKRIRRGGGFTLPTFLMGSLLVAGLAMKGQLGKPGGRAFHNKPVEPVSLHRAKQKANNKLRELYAKHQMDDTHPDKFQASFNRLPKEIQAEVLATRKAVFGKVQASKPPAREIVTTKQMTPDMQAFADQIGRARAEQAEKAAAKGKASAGDEGGGASAPRGGDAGADEAASG